MEQMIRFYMSVDKDDMDKIDQKVKGINIEKAPHRNKTNRQAIIRGLIKFALGQNLRFINDYGKSVTVRRKK